MTAIGAALPPRKCTFAEKITENPLTIFLASCIMSKLRNGSIAQPGEHLPYKQGVTGSSPVVPTNGPVAQLVRALACHARGRRFETVPGRHFSPKSGFAGFHIFASVAQLVEQRTENPRVAGSIPAGGTNRADVAHPVERHLAKVEVASSSLVIRSILLMPIKFNWHFFDRESVQFNTAP